MNIVRQAIEDNPGRYSLNLDYDDNGTIMLNFRDNEKKIWFNWNLGFAYTAITTFLDKPSNVFDVNSAMLKSWIEQVKMCAEEIEKQIDNAKTLEDLELAKQKYNEMVGTI